MTNKDFEDFHDFNKFDSSDDIVSPYDFDKPTRAGASRAKAIAVASAGFVVLGALVGGGAFAMTGNSSSTPAVSSVDPSVAPTDSTAIAPTESDDASDIDSSAPAVTPTVPSFSSDDDGDDQSEANQGDDNSGSPSFGDEGSDD